MWHSQAFYILPVDYSIITSQKLKCHGLNIFYVFNSHILSLSLTVQCFAMSEILIAQINHSTAFKLAIVKLKKLPLELANKNVWKG